MTLHGALDEGQRRSLVDRGRLQSIRQANQQTAAGTRQLDSAAGNLNDLSRQLVALADRYRV